MDNNKYSWNIAFQYIMNIKHQYMEKFNSENTYSLIDMCLKLNTPELNNFLKCVDIKVIGPFNIIKYSLIKGGDSDLYINENSIYRELRGIVVDMEKEEIVLCPFRKFFNIDELPETDINYVSSEIYNLLKNNKPVDITDKMDGSMLSAGWYLNKPFIAGSGSLDKNKNPRLKECEKWLKPYHKMLEENPGYTFIFEYISLNDRHVVVYTEKDEGLYLVGMRNKYTGKTEMYHTLKEYARRYDVPLTKKETKDFSEIIGSTSKFEGIDKEGWVINTGEHMYKLKTDDYINLHRIFMCINGNTVTEMIASNIFDDIRAKLPNELRKEADEIASHVYLYTKKMDRTIDYFYNKYKSIEDRKQFALEIQKNVPKSLVPYIFMKADGKEFEFLKKNGRVLKFDEIISMLSILNEII